MVQNEQERPALGQTALAGLLYEQDCPVGHKCLATDCMECLEMYADMEGETNGPSY